MFNSILRASLAKGHINHSLFWTNLAPPSTGGGELEAGELKSAIERDFGSFEEFKKKFNAETAGIQGSGWGWLVGISFRLVVVFWLRKLKSINTILGPQQGPQKARDCHDPEPGPIAQYAPVAMQSQVYLDRLSIGHIPIIGVDIWEHAFYLQVGPIYVRL